MELQFALVGCLFFMAAINLYRRRRVAFILDVVLGIALLVSTIAVICRE